MTYEQYWLGEPSLVIAYREAHKLKVEQKNQELWLQGLYVYNAVGVIAYNLFAGKGKTPQKYIEKPLELFPKKLTEEEIVEQRNKVIKSLTNFQNAWKGSNTNKGK